MAKLKTTATKVPVQEFVDKLPSENTRDDCYELIKIMQRATGEPPKMWGPSIIGFGHYHYKYESGHEGDMCIAGFSPRKTNLTVYKYPDQEVPKKLGKFTSSKACIYFKKLSDVDTKLLEKIIKDSVAACRKKYPGK